MENNKDKPYSLQDAEELRKENEVLNTRINKYRENFHAANYARNEAQIKYYLLSDEIERLKESNKELLEKLKKYVVVIQNSEDKIKK